MIKKNINKNCCRHINENNIYAVNKIKSTGLIEIRC